VSILYLFLDHSGNFDFSPSGSKYLVLACLSTEDIYSLTGELHRLKHDIILYGHELEFLHASNDPLPVRRQVYSLLNQFSHYRVDTIAVEKAKTHPKLYEVWRFYPGILTILFNWVFKFKPASQYDRVILFIDYLELPRDREAFLKGTKEAIMPHLTQRQRLDVFMHQSKSHFYLQAVDYFCWAMFRKYEFADTSYLALIPDKIKSDFDVFAIGKTRWY
jgi:hypothetical protein